MPLQAFLPQGCAGIDRIDVAFGRRFNIANADFRRLQRCRLAAQRIATAYDWVDRPGFLVFFDAQVAIVICGFDDGHGQALQDCNRTGKNLMLSAHARGLGSCRFGSSMQWLGYPAAQALLGVPQNYTPHAAFALGYPAGIPAGAPRSGPEVIWVA